jgi:hypothetical protein
VFRVGTLQTHRRPINTGSAAPGIVVLREHAVQKRCRETLNGLILME